MLVHDIETTASHDDETSQEDLEFELEFEFEETDWGSNGGGTHRC